MVYPVIFGFTASHIYHYTCALLDLLIVFRRSIPRKIVSECMME